MTTSVKLEFLLSCHFAVSFANVPGVCNVNLNRILEKEMEESEDGCDCEYVDQYSAVTSGQWVMGHDVVIRAN